MPIPLTNECNDKLAEIIFFFLPRYGEEIISVKILYDAGLVKTRLCMEGIFCTAESDCE